MKMQYLKTICLAVGFLSICATTLTAQDPYPTINPLATFTKSDGTNPCLIRIDSKAGHGGGKPLAKVLEEQADIYAFIFKHLGM